MTIKGAQLLTNHAPTLDDVEKVFDLRKVKRIFFEEDANFFKNFGDDGETSEGHTFFVELMKAILDKGHNDGRIELKRIVAVAAAEQDEAGRRTHADQDDDPDGLAQA